MWHALELTRVHLKK